jgi:cation-transporting ATPase E
VLGAPDVVLDAADPRRAEAERLGGQGLRVLAPGRLPDSTLSHVDGPLGTVEPAALVVLRQRLRPEAAPTLRYLGEQGIAVKVLSGDNAAAVGAVASALGVPGAHDPVDARDLADSAEGFAEEVDRHAVFGRVTPQRKRAMVRCAGAGTPSR